MYSVIIPVYRNAEFIEPLIDALNGISHSIRTEFGVTTEVIFVVDASPDDSYEKLADALPGADFDSKIVMHARNFGSFAAIRTGLAVAEKGSNFGVIAADLQEPPELLVDFFRQMVDAGADIVVGVRESREDPGLSRAASRIFWGFYRRVIMRDMPSGGVDVFACTAQVRDELLRLEESHSSLVGLLFWTGFRRAEVRYRRQARKFGKSAWTFRKKFTYMMDNIFAFTNLPIQLITLLGITGILVAVIYGSFVTLMRIFVGTEVPGYAATVVIVAFFGGINTLALGIIGSYSWRAYENTKRRPLSIIRSIESYASQLSSNEEDKS